MIEKQKPVPEQPKPVARQAEAAAARQVERASVVREASANQKKAEAPNRAGLNGLKESQANAAATKEKTASRQTEARAVRPETAQNKKTETTAAQPREGLKSKPEISAQQKKQEAAGDARTAAAQKAKAEGGGRIASSDQRQVEKKTAGPEGGDRAKKQSPSSEPGLNGLKQEKKTGDQQAQVTGPKEKTTGGPQAREGSKQTDRPKASTETRPTQRPADVSKPSDGQKTTERPKTTTEAPVGKKTQEAIVPGSQQAEKQKSSSEFRPAQKTEVSKPVEVHKPPGQAEKPKTTEEAPRRKQTQEGMVPGSQQAERPKTSPETRPGQKAVEGSRATEAQKPGQAERLQIIKEAPGERKLQEPVHHRDAPQSRQIENPSSSLAKKESDQKASTPESSLKIDAEDRKVAEERQNALEKHQEEQPKEHKQPTSAEQADKDANQLADRLHESKLEEQHAAKTETAEKLEESAKVTERANQDEALKAHEDRDRSAADHIDHERKMQQHAVQEAQRTERAKHDAAAHIQSIVRVGEAPSLPHQGTGIREADGDSLVNEPLRRFDNTLPLESQLLHEQVAPYDIPIGKEDGIAPRVIEAGLAKRFELIPAGESPVTNVVHTVEQISVENKTQPYSATRDSGKLHDGDVDHRSAKIGDAEYLPLPPYPPNRGFIGKTESLFLQPGTLIDRFGPKTGKFVSPCGTPLEARSLDPWTSEKPYSSYKVTKPIEVVSGQVAPYYNHFGLGTQYELPLSIADLLEMKCIEIVTL